MEVGLLRRIFAAIVVMLVLASNLVFPSANERGEHNFIWVVALEKDSPDEISSEWNPTLCKIDIEQAKVVEKRNIAEQGAPRFCYSLPGNRLRVILSEGIAANGTYVAKETTIDLTIDKNGMRILATEAKEGYNDYQEYMKMVLSDKNKSLNIDRPKQFIKKKGEVFLGTSKVRPRAFMLKGFFIDKRDLSLEILAPDTLTPIHSIPLKVGNRKLGGFSGASWGDATLIADRYVICSFDGAALLGYFDPGYIVIVDTELKIVKYVAIGSNPARGIAY